MQIIEKSKGKKIDYELNGTSLSFADGALTVDLARSQRDSVVTLDVRAVPGDGPQPVSACCVLTY